MSDKITSSPLAAALLAAGLTLGSAGAANAAAPAAFDPGANTPTVSSLLAMDEDGRLVVEEKIFDEMMLADIGDVIRSLYPELCDDGGSGCDGQIYPV